MGSRNRFNKREVAPAPMQAPPQVRSRAENRRSTSVGSKIEIPSLMTPGVTYGDPTPAIEPGNRPRGPMFMDPVGPSREMPGASSFMDPVAPKDADVTKLQGKPGRQILPQETTKENVNGVVQTGKDLSGGAASDFRMSGGVSAAFVPEYANSSFNDLLAAQGNERYSAFSSNQLPTTQANPFEGTAPKTDSFNPAAPGITGATYDNYGAAGGAAAALPGTLAEKDQFNPSAARIEGGSSRRPGGSLSEALADTAGINSYMDKFSSGDRERAAGMAFLNGTDSYDGLRKRDAVNGVVYAGGQHYIDGGEGNPAQRLTDPQNARDIASGKAKAQDFLKSKIDTTVDTQKQTASEAQDPLSAAGSAVKSGFAAGAATDFELNNSQATPQTGVGPVVAPEIIENYDFNKPGAEEAYFKKLNSGGFF